MNSKQDVENCEFEHIESSAEERNNDQHICRQFIQRNITKQNVLHWTAQLLLICFFIAILYGILGKDVLPGSEIFALLLLYVLAFIGGKLIGLIYLPPLLGMLIAGFLYRNLPFIPFAEDISIKWASTLRGSALVVILLKAGLGLDAEKLKKLKAVVLQLAFAPCIIESITISVASRFLLELPWIWGILLGFVIAAVSPAVVVPSLLKLQKKKLGTNKGIPTLVIAAASVDDILAITGFSIMLGISLSGGSWIWSLAKGILEPLAGFIFGITCGCTLWYVPSIENSKNSLICYRMLLLFCGGLAVMFMSKILDFGGAGPFGCLVLGFVASFRWKLDFETFPYLFSLIGSEVTISSLKLDIESSILVLVISLTLRVLTAFIATVGGGLNWKEKIFVAFAWLPKATVQAAVGPQALDYVLSNDKGPEMENYAKKVLSVAVLSILITAPIGAILISLLGPILLTHENNNNEADKNKIQEDTVTPLEDVTYL